jgi:hypothetical protein
MFMTTKSSKNIWPGARKAVAKPMSVGQTRTLMQSATTKKHLYLTTMAQPGGINIALPNNAKFSIKFFFFKII